MASLFDRFLDKSPRYMWCWHKARRHTDDLMASFDREGLARLRDFKDHSPHPHYKKYFNASYWLRRNMQRALFLGLSSSHPALRILDLGAGFGYFPYIARFFGHEAEALDLPGQRLFEESCRFLDVPQTQHTISAEAPLLPGMTKSYDLITAFQICFNAHYTDTPWGAQDWEKFLDGLLKRHLKPGGRIYLEFNYHHGIGCWISDDVNLLLKSKYKARMNGRSRVLITRGA